MQHTGMPVWKLTAGFIVNTFRSSGKSYLRLAGALDETVAALSAQLKDRGIPVIGPGQEKEAADAFVLTPQDPFGGVGCVIMASGLGVRFGGNKLMADFRGQPLIAGALAATAEIPRRVVVTRHRDVAEYCRQQGVQVILHGLPHRSDTVRLGVEAMAGTACCIFCQGDQPLLRQDTVNTMALLGLQQNASILRAAAGEVLGAPLLFPSRFYPQLLTLPQGKGGNFVAKKYPEQVQNIPVQDYRELLDVDTPEDLAFLSGQ